MNRQKFQCHILWNRIVQQLLHAPEHIVVIPGLERQSNDFKQSEKKQQQLNPVVQEPNGPMSETKPSHPITNDQKPDIEKFISYQPVRNPVLSSIKQQRIKSKHTDEMNCLASNASTACNLNQHHEQSSWMQNKKSDNGGNNLQLPFCMDHHCNMSDAAVDQGQSRASGETWQCLECSQKMEPFVADYSSRHYARVSDIYRKSSMKKSAIERQVLRLLKDRL
jgi:hypothetical protein